MNLMRTTLLFQASVIKRNKWTSALVLLTTAIVLWHAGAEGHRMKAAAYLLALGLGVFITDLFALWKTNAPAPPVHAPRRETAIVLGCAALGYLTLSARFVFLDWPTLPGPVKLAIIPFFAFVFPIALAIIMLRRGYKPRELGFRWRSSSFVFLPVLCITASTAYIVAPQDLTLPLILKEEGVPGMLFDGFILAALSEEFLRLLMQTRMAAMLNNSGIAWFIAAVIWSVMHLPKWFGDGGGTVLEGLTGSLHIVPLGLMWGYMTHRTKSIFPAILVHGMNVWGLQNF
jgi:membrane protease YdiL (CAAX protease family)